MKIIRTSITEPAAPIILLLAFLLLLPGCGPGSSSSAKPAHESEEAFAERSDETPQEVPETAQQGEEKEVEKNETLVIVTPLMKGPITSHIEVSSDIESLNVVDIYPELSGLKIEEILVDEACIVNKGDVLARLDSEETRLELRQTEADYKEALKNKTKSGIALREAKKRVEAAKIQKEKLLGDYMASKELAQEGILSDKELSADRLTWEQAVSDFDLRVLEEQQAALDADLASNSAEKASIALDNSKLKLSRTAIRAPWDGVISYRNAALGMTVTSSTKLFILVDRKTLIANLFVPQEDIPRIRKDMPVYFSCDTMPGKVWSGKVDLVSPVVDPTNGTIKIRVRIPSDPEECLRPGMFISARIVVSSRESAWLVQRKAVFYEDEIPCFFIVGENAAKKVLFDRGAATSKVLEIVNPRYESGEEILLEEGIPVVVVGQDNLKNGDAVQISDTIQATDELP